MSKKATGILLILLMLGITIMTFNVLEKADVDVFAATFEDDIHE